ncbi:AMP-binding protein [Streptomyces sp. ventii]|uniref:AMP-binding protein n=1 Tax=Streptomyces spiramenti TaxID=2720606 RepID=A0ABX1APW2_9ACTN|nr:AMP-binding protein [Streptomyces spiramenti]
MKGLPNVPTPTPPALSQGPPLQPGHDDPGNAVEALLRAARNAPTAGVVTLAADGTTTRLDYPALLERARRILGGLRRHGVAAGDTVILQGLPLADHFAVFWACVLGGVRPAALVESQDPDTTGPVPERLAHTWRLLGEPLVVSDTAGTAVLARQGGPTAADVDRLADGPPAVADHRPEPDDVALLMLSSGSTGAPKAAQLTHRALSLFAASSADELEVGAGDVSLNWLPVDHSGAFLIYHLMQVYLGNTNVHLPTELVLARPLRWLELMAEWQVRHSWAPMFGYRLISRELAAAPELSWELSGVRTLLCGGEQIKPEAAREFLDAVAPFGVREETFRPAWGMAETTTAITWGRFASPTGVRRVVRSSLGGELVWADAATPEHETVTFVAVGPPAAESSLRVVDTADRLLTERRIGRLQVDSVRVTTGYANNPAATAAALTADGWLDTGDLAFLADGELVITGRSKDVLILNGHNYTCHEIEDAATAASGVVPGTVGACGVPDADSGSERLYVGFASATGDPEQDAATAREVRAAVFRRLRLSDVRVVAVPEAEFPRTKSGKVRRDQLARMIGGTSAEPAHSVPTVEAATAASAVGTPGGTTVGTPGAAPAGARDDADSPGAGPAAGADAPRPDAVGTVLTAVRAAIAAAAGRHVADDVAFFDLGLNSLALARVRAALELDLGTKVAAAAFYEHPTVADLARHVAEHVARPAVAGAPGATAQRAAPPAGGGPTDRRIAIIGMSARFPGAPDIDRFWANLREGRDSVGDFTAAHAAAGPVDPALRPVAGVLTDVDAFDAAFFGVSRAEARLIDPAHRLFLETCYLALEHGGHAGDTAGERIGVFAGSGMHLYGHQDAPGSTGDASHDDGAAAVHAATGGLPDFLATRVAHRLNLAGPAIGVQTACSTSLVAVHLAVQALLSGDADLALAGAAAVRLPQEAGYRHEPGSILSGTGRCRPFDADADGTVGGNGVAAVLLKPLDRALADGDTVHAVIAGTAINNDGGAKAGFTAPSVGGHADVVRAALLRAGVAADTVSYLEAHGTGTAVGDPVEFRALTRALAGRPADAPRCALGSVKGNIGHLDTCAGMAGLIKTVLMLRHRELVPTVNLSRPHPDMDWSGGPFHPATELRPWVSRDGGPLRAGVSALGVGGTNAHVVLEEAPPVAAGPRTAAAGPVVLPLSAADAATLAELVTRVADHLDSPSAPPAADVVRTLALGRRHLTHRRAVTGRTTAELVAALRQSDRVADRAQRGPLAFAFSGQGDLRPGSATRLYEDFPRARAVLDRCEALFHAHAPDAGGLLEPLCGAAPTGSDAGAPWPTATAQTALFALQAAQWAAWHGVGVTPAVVLGHSVGEYAALHAAGALTLADGVRITAERGRLMQATAPGGMLAVVADAARSAELAARCGLEVAAANAPGHHVLAGPDEAVRAAGAVLNGEGVAWRALAVDRAFHTALMDGALDGLRTAVEGLELHPLRFPLITTADAVAHAPGTVLTGDYLVTQARRAVEFADSLAEVAASGCTDFLELGPGRVLSGVGRRALPRSRWTPTLPEPDGDAVWPAVAALYELGVDPDWTELTPEGRRVPLPAHPLRRTRFGEPAKPGNSPAEPATTQTAASAPAGRSASSDAEAAVEPVSVAEVAATVAAEQTGVVLARVREVVGKRLGSDADEVDAEGTFLEQGADSLSMMAAARDLATEFDVRVPVRDLFGDSDTPEKLARAIAAQLPAPTVPSTPTAPTAPEHAPAARPSAPAMPAAPPAPAARPAPPMPTAPPAVSAAAAAPAVSADAGTTGGGASADSRERLVERQLALSERLVERVTATCPTCRRRTGASPWCSRTTRSTRT